MWLIEKQSTNITSVTIDENCKVIAGGAFQNCQSLKTVYYNGNLISYKNEYDINTLLTLDTSVPGSYRILYSVERYSGEAYGESNEVEIIININSPVATVNNVHLNYISLAVALVSAITVMLTFLFLELKKKNQSKR